MEQSSKKGLVVVLTAAALLVLSIAYQWTFGGSARSSFAYTYTTPLTIEVAVDPDGTVVRKTGVATISGTVTCSSPVSVGLFGELRQLGRQDSLITGFFSIPGMSGEPIQCNGVDPAPWTVTVRSQSGGFSQGQANVFVAASACDPVTGRCDNDETNQTVRLRGSKT